MGTTSACAENTPQGCNPWGTEWNYLRVRGEYTTNHVILRHPWELPPRARRIRLQVADERAGVGTTSACAENTACHHHGFHYSGNYLRVRGEYNTVPLVTRSLMELPPRARRIQSQVTLGNHFIGTTSACAENTSWIMAWLPIWRNYLRVRGEYRISSAAACALTELPPRARRIRPARHGRDRMAGTTSACAENTHRRLHGLVKIGNYLRVRGEYVFLCVFIAF